MMDDCCAPQWTDFTSSPQIPSDDYFEKIHEVHEPQLYKEANELAETASFKEPQNADEIFGNDLNIVKSTPVKVISPNSRSQNVVIKETTYDDVLCQAMKNLELSLKNKKARRSAMTESTPNTLRTPSTRVLRSTTRNSVKKVLEESDVFKTPKGQDIRSAAAKTLNESSIYKTPRAQEIQNTPPKVTNNETDILKAPMVPEVQNNIQAITESQTDVQKEMLNPVEVEELLNNIKEEQEEHDSDNAAIILKIEDDHEVDEGDFVAVENNVEELCEKKYKVPTNLVTSFSGRRRGNTEKERRSQGGQSKVLAGQYCQYRRRSMMKIRRRSNKYVSLAEAVSKFQTGTPKRFRSVSNKDLKPSAVTKLRRTSLKLTFPISPTLSSKTRTRPLTVLSKEQREALELEEIKKHQIKANPINVNALKGPQHLKKPEKKPATVPEPFHLTESRKMHTASTSTLQESVRDHNSTTKSMSCTMPSNGSINTHKEPEGTKGLASLKKSNTVSESMSLTNSRRTRITSSSSDTTRHEVPKKNVVPSIVSTDDIGITVKHEEVLFFGIPVNHAQKKATHTIPFSFETRNKEFQKKKEEKLKQLHHQETNKVKTEFRAKPAPNFSKSASQVKDAALKKHSALPCPFSFQERNNLLLKKKEELVKHVVEEEKKARVFHAKPAPEFKPVVVHGVSNEKKCKEKAVDNQKKSTASENKVTMRQKSKDLIKMTRKTIGGISKTSDNPEFKNNLKNDHGMSVDFQKQQATTNDKQSIDQENRQPNIMSRRTEGQEKMEKYLKGRKVAPPELSTDKRMKQRLQFEEKLRQKELEEEEKRQKAEEERLAKEKMEKALLRKQAEIKARPMPVYKPLVLSKSTKPLTNPQSPAFTFKMKQRALVAKLENQT